MGKVVSLFSRDEKEVLEKMDVANFRIEVIRPALKIAGLWSESAENLLLGTALAESGLNVLTQFGSGPALSFFQIEPNTYDDIIRYLYRHDNQPLKDRVMACCMLDIFPDAKCLVWNMRLSVLIARVIYARKAEPLPKSCDIEGLASYWKRHYNTIKGAGTVEHFIKSWNNRVN